MALKVGEIKTVGEFMPYEEWLASRFYREWIAPQGLGDGMYGLFEKSATSHAGVALIKSARDGPIDDEAKRRFGLLFPHFRRAVAIGQIIDLHKFEAAALADSLDGLAAATFLVDADAHLVHVNTAAQEMLTAADVVRATANRFSAMDRHADSALRDIFAVAEKGDQAISTKGIDVSLASRDGERYVAHVLPLTSGARRKAGVAYNAVAAVFVHKAKLDLPHPLETIANVFNLTSAEMRVLMMIVQLGGVREVAPVLGIGEPTVKTHLQHIFEKTGASRQADLVKLVAGYLSPLGA
jgi:DNA-binding CsgD family transcriptional regulator